MAVWLGVLTQKEINVEHLLADGEHESAVGLAFGWSFWWGLVGFDCVFE